MKKISRADIVDYQTYEELRPQIRSQAMAEKEKRRIHLGPYLTFLFENTLTIQYQIQEMMKAERIVKESEIIHEIETYNELLGKKGELGCTLLIEITDVQDRDQKLRQWIHLPQYLYLECDDGKKPCVYDPRQVGEDRLSSVQYLKFFIGHSRPIALVVDHPQCKYKTTLSEDQIQTLVQDSLSS